MRICIFGDSITEGFYDDEKNGWVNRIKNNFSSDEIINLGVSGDTTEDLLSRFDEDIVGKEPDMIIFAIGINDSIYLPKQKHNYVNFDKFKENIKALIEKSKKFTGKIIFIGLTPVDESLTMPISWELEMHYSNEQVGKYDNAIGELCKGENIKFIDILSDFSREDYKSMLSDGLHPNAEGHKWMANKIAKELNKK